MQFVKVAPVLAKIQALCLHFEALWTCDVSDKGRVVSRYYG
jgi:hypothetical protein